MSESVELEAVSVTVRPVSDCFSQLSVKVTPSFSYTCTEGAVGNRRKCFVSLKAKQNKHQNINTGGDFLKFQSVKCVTLHSLISSFLFFPVRVYPSVTPGASGAGSKPPSRSSRSPPAVPPVLMGRPGAPPPTAGLGCRGSSEPPSRSRRSHT